MILATHILAAGAATKPFLGRVNNFAIFIISILSHYLADTIPHYDYKLLSIDWKEGHKKEAEVKFNLALVVIDLLNIAIDIALGCSLLFIVARPEITFANFITYSLIVIGSILPDALQPLFILWKKFPMTIMQDVHDFWHAELRLKFNKTAVISQAAFIILSALVIYVY